MQATAIFISIFAAIFVSTFLVLLPLWTTEEEKARTRRRRDAEMNARLLRLNL